MNIIIIWPFAYTKYYGGVQAQTRMWKSCLEKLGHNVKLHNNESETDWTKIDVVLFMWYGKLLFDYVQMLKSYSNLRLVIAPIIDYTGTMFSFILRSRLYGSIMLRYHKELHDFYSVRNLISCYLVRSEHEKMFLTKGFGLSDDKIHIVPLSYRINEPKIDLSKKENFCLHVSRLAFPGKNVRRLIEAAKQYHFDLKLAGALNGKSEYEWLASAIGEAKNIEYIGRPSDTELMEWYNRAKVFALPSFVEGVGMVAMEAAIYGCEIVLTNIGGPQEYYDGRAILVNPHSLTDIGEGVLKAMKGYAQPELKTYIENNYNERLCSKLLEQALLVNT